MLCLDGQGNWDYLLSEIYPDKRSAEAALQEKNQEYFDAPECSDFSTTTDDDVA